MLIQNIVTLLLYCHVTVMLWDSFLKDYYYVTCYTAYEQNK